MANMNYCKFETTSSDFADCVNALQEGGLSNLSSSERSYAEKLYELAKAYTGLYEMDLQSSEEESDIPTPEQKKCWFLQYYKVQMKGDYNMICDSENAAKTAGLSLDTYFYIQTNYNTFRNMFSDECEVIDKQIMEELKYEG